MRFARMWVQGAIACLSSLLVAACATMPRNASLPISDPHEATNRQVLAANQRTLGPLSEVVKTIPGPVHDRLHDLNSNLKEPRIFVNDVLQRGVSDGPYVVLPYMGPATTRDAFGSIVDMAADPLGWLLGTQIASTATHVMVSAGTTSLDAADRLGQLKQAEDSSIDFYSFIRSGYYQTRRAELREALGLPRETQSPATSGLDDPGGDK
jgi:phospholipid-binding lipoprotein MlaA